MGGALADGFQAALRVDLDDNALQVSVQVCEPWTGQKCLVHVTRAQEGACCVLRLAEQRASGSERQRSGSREGPQGVQRGFRDQQATMADLVHSQVPLNSCPQVPYSTPVLRFLCSTPSSSSSCWWRGSRLNWSRPRRAQQVVRRELQRGARKGSGGGLEGRREGA